MTVGNLNMIFYIEIICSFAAGWFHVPIDAHHESMFLLDIGPRNSNYVIISMKKVILLMY